MLKHSAHPLALNMIVSAIYTTLKISILVSTASQSSADLWLGKTTARSCSRTVAHQSRGRMDIQVRTVLLLNLVCSSFSDLIVRHLSTPKYMGRKCVFQGPGEKSLPTRPDRSERGDGTDPYQTPDRD